MSAVAGHHPEAPAAASTALQVRRRRWSLRGHAVEISAAVVILLFLSGLVIPWAAHSDPNAMGPDSLVGPSWAHPFGTDEIGRDLFVRVLYGMRISTQIAIVTAVVAGVIGTVIGLYAGYYVGWRDSIIMRIADFFLGFPALILAMIIVAVLGPSTLTPMFATILISIPLFARMVRASTLAEREKEYVLAARSLGAKPLHIMLKTILPSVSAIVLVQAAIVAALAVQIEAGLSFLGVGVPPPNPSLGSMLYSSLSYVNIAPWYGVFPGVALFLLVCSLIVFSNALEARNSIRPGAIETGRLEQ